MESGLKALKISRSRFGSPANDCVIRPVFESQVSKPESECTTSREPFLNLSATTSVALRFRTNRSRSDPLRQRITLPSEYPEPIKVPSSLNAMDVTVEPGCCKSFSCSQLLLLQKATSCPAAVTRDFPSLVNASAPNGLLCFRVRTSVRELRSQILAVWSELPEASR